MEDHSETVAQWAHYGQAIMAHNQRTDTANRFYLTIQVALLAGAGVALQSRLELDVNIVNAYMWVGIAVSILWFATLGAHRSVNRAMHETIQSYEIANLVPLDLYTLTKAKLDERRFIAWVDRSGKAWDGFQITHPIRSRDKLRFYIMIGWLMQLLPLVFVAAFVTIAANYPHTT